MMTTAMTTSNSEAVMTTIVISSGHGKYIRGASCSPRPPYLDEVDEARRMVSRIAELWSAAGVSVKTFNDDTSTTQSQNLQTIVNYHNAQARDLDVSVHFNAYQKTSKPMGVEVLYVTQQQLAADTSAAIAAVGGFTNRGPKKRTDLYFLNTTNKPAILLEVCFVDSETDANLYRNNFDNICKRIAEVVGNVTIGKPEPPPVEPPPTDPEDPAVPLFPSNQSDIKCSVFGGAKDPNDSAYPPYDKITDQEISCALPWRFPGTKPLVLVHNLLTGLDALCEIRDIGPWLTDDPYFDTGERPLAETCFLDKTPLPRGPNAGIIPNGAGIDITPAAAKSIGLSGMGQVSWCFQTEPDVVA
jgi:N-acetylmuramoyl-L-alanine amidase